MFNNKIVSFFKNYKIELSFIIVSSIIAIIPSIVFWNILQFDIVLFTNEWMKTIFTGIVLFILLNYIINPITQKKKAKDYFYYYLLLPLEDLIDVLGTRSTYRGSLEDWKNNIDKRYHIVLLNIDLLLQDKLQLDLLESGFFKTLKICSESLNETYNKKFKSLLNSQKEESITISKDDIIVLQDLLSIKKKLKKHF